MTAPEDLGSTGERRVDITKNQEQSRYELRVDGELVGVADYVAQPDRIVFPHTEVTPSYRGHGYGEKLVHAALEDVRRAGGRVVAHCWFVAGYIRAHPEFADLLA
jgi:predicted GNAT family acetyltransferase